MYCTEAVTLKARKVHRCMSCGEDIFVGDTYKRWRCYDNGDASTVKMHPECYAMHCEDADGSWEFTPYSHDRPSAEDVAGDSG